MFSKKGQQKSRRGFTLVETMIACALFSIAGIALASVYLYSTRAFAAMANYAQLDENNRLGMDKMTKEIREARLIMQATNDGSSATVTILANNGDTVKYTFDSHLQALTRMVNGNVPQIMIPNCQMMAFDVRQRTPTNGVFDNFPTLTTNDSIQVITLTWRAWKSIPGTSTNVGTSEEIQSAYVVVRNQHFMQNGGVVFSE
jgi:prepilin-type N-terminal cleavage/methylation domain-containing protein